MCKYLTVTPAKTLDLTNDLCSFSDKYLLLSTQRLQQLSSLVFIVLKDFLERTP